MPDTKFRVLVVDDDALQLEMLVRGLERNGYEVSGASSGPEAVQCVRKSKVDLVLLDHMMQDMTGLDVLRIVRRTYSATELPIIIVTASNDPNTVREAVKLGANDYITKPVDLARVLARIRVHLGRAAEQNVS